MGQAESCCGKRTTPDTPSMPTRQMSALGNKYVTFQPETTESFKLRTNVWYGTSTYEVKDTAGHPWFKLEGRDNQLWQKKLILNTGIHHATVERKENMWHFYVAKERRATITKYTNHSNNSATVYSIYLHSQPYPHMSSADETGLTEPIIRVDGDVKGLQYRFLEVGGHGVRMVARVDKLDVDQGRGFTNYICQIAPAVDVAMILIASIAIDSDQYPMPERLQQDGELTGRSGVTSLDSSKTDDRWRASLDKIPIQLPQSGKKATPDKNNSSFDTPSKVPPLWSKGKTPRNGAQV